MFVGASSVQTAFTFGDLIEWLIPAILIFCGINIVKKDNKNKRNRGKARFKKYV